MSILFSPKIGRDFSSIFGMSFENLSFVSVSMEPILCSLNMTENICNL